jgi:hypothetical protein
VSKNLIYMTAVNHDTSTYKNSDYARYAKVSWKFWCKRNNIDFIVLDKHNPRYKFPVWNKDTIFDIVGDTYNKIGYVDSDTMVHWNAPNPFDLYTDEWCWVKDQANLRWTTESINNYQRFYPNQTLDIYDYYNSGVSFFTKEHKPIFDNLIKLYENNSEELDKCATMGGGKVQTLLNFELQKHDIKVKELSPQWNMFSMHKREMFRHNFQDGDDKTPHFVKRSWIWHYTGFPIEARTKLMRETWELFGTKYTNYEK